MIVPPVTYQGAKTRIASKVVDVFAERHDGRFHDLCCGSGAIAIEMINRGFPVTDITMLDIGPWGELWEQVGAGTFDMDSLRYYTTLMPTDLSAIHGFLSELALQPASVDTTAVFLLLQAGAFGGKAIWRAGDTWCNATFRKYWVPTPTSSRRSPVNPMMPGPDTILRRVDSLLAVMAGVRGVHASIEDFRPDGRGFAYIDPPYAGVTGYGSTFDVDHHFRRIGDIIPCYVSESRQVGDNGKIVSEPRRKGGISGQRRSANAEWVSWRIPALTATPS